MWPTMLAATFDRACEKRAPVLLGSVGVVAIPLAFAATATIATLLLGTVVAMRTARRSRTAVPLAVPA